MGYEGLAWQETSPSVAGSGVAGSVLGSRVGAPVRKEPSALRPSRPGALLP